MQHDQNEPINPTTTEGPLTGETDDQGVAEESLQSPAVQPADPEPKGPPGDGATLYHFQFELYHGNNATSLKVVDALGDSYDDAYAAAEAEMLEMRAEDPGLKWKYLDTYTMELVQ